MAKMVLFSAVQGRVLEEGRPVSGATVEREYKWGWKDETGRDSTRTGPDGSFAMPAIERSSLLGSLLPHEPVVRQSLTIQHAGRSYEGWLYFKRNYRADGELDGKPLKLVCRLERPAQRHGNGVYGICEFE
mgnify:FL=1